MQIIGACVLSCRTSVGRGTCLGGAECERETTDGLRGCRVAVWGVLGVLRTVGGAGEQDGAGLDGAECGMQCQCQTALSVHTRLAWTAHGWDGDGVVTSSHAQK